MKIVFVLPQFNSSHTNRRIRDFLDHGYEVEAYGFDREGNKTISDLPCEIKIIGQLVSERYLSRVIIYLKVLNELGKKYKGQKVVLYFRGLDLAMFFHFLHPEFPYIFEECDLTHTYSKGERILELIAKRIIRKSLLTIFTSEGFIKYHFGKEKIENAVLIENKLPESITKYPIIPREKFEKSDIRIGFVGSPRFNSIHSFIDKFCRQYPGYTLHVYGGPIREDFEDLKQYKNCVFHGFFKNPQDLPEIYSKIDLVLATYDTSFTNVRYAEPNKLYEAIYFETPIIASKGTFLGDKVCDMGIGYQVDAMSESDIKRFVDGLTDEDLRAKRDAANRIDKEKCIVNTEVLFRKLNQILS